jgi:hypothetical protein
VSSVRAVSPATATAAADTTHVTKEPLDCGGDPPQRRLITTSMGSGRADELIAALPARAWSRISCGLGAHGPRDYDWARLPIRICWQPGRGHWLLARRNITTGELAYYVCYGPERPGCSIWPASPPPAGPSKNASNRPRTRLDWTEYQVRDWRAWHAHITLSMAALAWLVVARTMTTKGEPTAATA